MLTVNTEAPYPHFFHQVTVADITALDLSGDADISYIGFGPSDLTPAPRVGFNLTFLCPEDQVFDHDWFATPFIMMTCQVNWKQREVSTVFLIRKMVYSMSRSGRICSVCGVSLDT